MPDTDEEWLVLRTYGSLPEAQMMRSLLESEEVQVYIQGEQHRSMLGFVGAYIDPRLMVHVDDAERAEKILQDAEQARANPEGVHYICVPGEESQELKDLDNLVVDLASLTVCSIGGGTTRTMLQEQLGLGQEHGDEELEIRYPDLGTVFYLDDQDRVAGVMVIALDHDDFPDLQSYPGFWDPGSKLDPPDRKQLESFYGEPTYRDHASADWEQDGHEITALFNRKNKLKLFTVDYALD